MIWIAVFGLVMVLIAFAYIFFMPKRDENPSRIEHDADQP